MLEVSLMAEHARLVEQAKDLIEEDLVMKPFELEKFQQEFNRAGWNLLKMKGAIRRAMKHAWDVSDPS